MLRCAAYCSQSPSCTAFIFLAMSPSCILLNDDATLPKLNDTPFWTSISSSGLPWHIYQLPTQTETTTDSLGSGEGTTESQGSTSGISNLRHSANLQFADLFLGPEESTNEKTTAPTKRNVKLVLNLISPQLGSDPVSSTGESSSETNTSRTEDNSGVEEACTYKYFEEVNMCMYVSKGKRGEKNAQDMCRSRNGQLLALNDEKHFAAFRRDMLLLSRSRSLDRVYLTGMVATEDKQVDWAFRWADDDIDKDILPSGSYLVILKEDEGYNISFVRHTITESTKRLFLCEILIG